MKIKWEKRAVKRTLYALFVSLISISFYCLITNLRAVSAWFSNLLSPITPVFGGLILAYLLSPILNKFEYSLLARIGAYNRMGERRRRYVSILLTYLVTGAAIAIFVGMVMPKVFSSATHLARQIGSYAAAAERVVNYLLNQIPGDLLPSETVAELENFVANMTKSIVSLLSGSVPAVFSSLVWIGNTLIDAFVAVVVSIYVLTERESFGARAKKITYALLSNSGAENLLEIVNTADRILGGFIIGKVVDSTIIGVLCYIGTIVLGIPNAMLVSFIVGVTNVIPYFGPFIGAIPSFFLIAIVSIEKGLVFAVFIFILQQLDGSVIGPKILGESIGLSSFWIVFSVLFFGGALGIKGMIIGVPLFALIYWWSKIMVANKLAAKGMPTETAAYKKPGSPKFDDEEKAQ